MGAVASGPPGRAAGLVHADFVSGGSPPSALAVGLFTLAHFAFLAATYLTIEAEEPALRDDFRLRALVAAGVTAGLGAVVVALAGTGAPLIQAGLLGNPLLIVGTTGVAIGAAAALYTRRWQAARVLAAGQIALVVCGWAWGAVSLPRRPGSDYSRAPAPSRPSSARRS